VGYNGVFHFASWDIDSFYTIFIPQVSVPQTSLPYHHKETRQGYSATPTESGHR